MINFNEIKVLSWLMDTDPISNVTRPAVVKRYVCHIANTVQRTKRFDTTMTVAKTSRDERTYALTCTSRDAERSSVIVTIEHRHPAYNGRESVAKTLLLHVSTHLDGRFEGHRQFDASQTDGLLAFVTHLAKALRSTLVPTLV